MRLLQTSDWHLGALIEGLSREEDQAFFLEWLHTVLVLQGVDSLVLAGDIFDQAHPSAEAQRQFYRFMAGLRGTPVQQAVVVAGNHDSPSRLEAPSDLLLSQGVHVLGTISSDPRSWERHLCPLKQGDGQVAAVVVAVPYVHEYRLGVRTSLVDEATIRQSFMAQFSALYRGLCDQAQALAPGVPVVATGHMAVAGGLVEDAPVSIHHMETIGGLPPEVFDERFCHVALGHFHRMFRVAGSRAWYCGSPVPLGPVESRTTRRVLLVDLPEEPGEPARVTPLAVPCLRQVLELAGTLSELVETLRGLSFSTPRPPLVQAAIRVAQYTPGLEETLRRATAELPGEKPTLLRVSQDLVRPERDGEQPIRIARPLRDLPVTEVFVRLCEARGEPPDSALLTAFRSLLVDSDEPEPGTTAEA